MNTYIPIRRSKMFKRYDDWENPELIEWENKVRLDNYNRQFFGPGFGVGFGVGPGGPWAGFGGGFSPWSGGFGPWAGFGVGFCFPSRRCYP
jgi:hypothetical protein